MQARPFVAALVVTLSVARAAIAQDAPVEVADSPTFGSEPAPERLDVVPGEIAVDLRDDMTEPTSPTSARYGVCAPEQRVEPHPRQARGRAVSLAARARCSTRSRAIRASRRRADGGPARVVRPERSALQEAVAPHARRRRARLGATPAGGASPSPSSTPASRASTRGRSRAAPTSAGTRCDGGYNFVPDATTRTTTRGTARTSPGRSRRRRTTAMGTAGLAFCATLMPVKVLNRHGWGTLADVAEGIRYAADHGAQVINL